MTECRCLDTSRIKRALEESKAAFDYLDEWCSFSEFENHMKLLDYRSDLFGIDAVHLCTHNL